MIFSESATESIYQQSKIIEFIPNKIALKCCAASQTICEEFYIIDIRKLKICENTCILEKWSNKDV